MKPNVALRGACVSCHEDSLNTTLVEGPSFETTYPELSLLSCSSSCSCFTFSTLRGAVDEPSSASPLRGASSSVLLSLTSVFDGSGSVLFRVMSGFSSYERRRMPLISWTLLGGLQKWMQWLEWNSMMWKAPCRPQPVHREVLHPASSFAPQSWRMWQLFLPLPPQASPRSSDPALKGGPSWRWWQWRCSIPQIHTSTWLMRHKIPVTSHLALLIADVAEVQAVKNCTKDTQKDRLQTANRSWGKIYTNKSYICPKAPRSRGGSICTYLR